MPGTLYVVATPIGNLEDVTLRALRILREVSLIAAEDTRRTARLLQHYSISTRTTSLHEHNERTKTPALIARLHAGESIALVSDAGTPVVSDPGTHLVAAAHAAGIRVEPVPGASAALAALSASGLLEREFIFAGFPPNRSSARKRWLEGLAAETRVLIFYETPHRIRITLEDMLSAFGDRVVAIGRELTKAHEELVVRPISEHLQLLSEERGEFTLIISGQRPKYKAPEEGLDPDKVTCDFVGLTTTGAKSRREALRTLAAQYDIPAREVFALLERAKKSVN
jgi:16S rRNA (cytidine1402-2'-O)-methyltransferase